MARISVNNLTFSYDDYYDNIFEDVSFAIDSNWKLGFVARNGRGKSTFLNLLMGKYEYSGTIQSDLEFLYFPIGIPEEKYSHNVIDLMEEVFPDVEFWRVCMELNLLEMDAELLYRPFQTLSYGECTRVMLAYLFAGEHKFLLLDEPTNHLDVECREKIKEYLAKKEGFILVSHDRDILDACIDHVLVINKTNIEVVKGNFSTWYENKERQDQFEKDKNESLKKDIGRLTTAARQARTWADKVESAKIGYDPKKDSHRCIDTRAYMGEKSRRMQQRRKNLEGRIQKGIEEKQGLLKNVEEIVDLKLFPEEFYKRYIFTARDLEIGYNGKKVGGTLTFEIERGDRIAIVGGNGSGKSTLIKTLLGQLKPIGGELNCSQGVRISYVAQSASLMKGTLEEYARKYGIDYTVFLSVLRQLDFERVQFEKRMEEYSEGQKKKVEIARSLCEKAHLYIWDEPMNYIDVFSRMQIERVIETFRPTMIFVEHDKTFVEHISTKKIVVS